MTSDIVYVWAWPAGSTTPVPAGVLRPGARGLYFRYGRGWLNRPDAFALGPDLPLRDEDFAPSGDLRMPGSIRDAAPDTWGRRVISDRVLGDPNRDPNTVDPQVFLLESGSNRLGAIDFQASVDGYVARDDDASLDDLQRAADAIAAGEILPPQLAAAAQHGTTMGGARPKATISDSTGDWIAKFSTSADSYDVIHAEAMGVALARRAGIDVPQFRLVRSLGRDVLLTRRFDRGPGGTRRAVVSGLTMLGLDDTGFSQGSYPELLDVIRTASADPARVGEDLFRRVAFNIAIRNGDDHLRNHAAFWDGEHLDLTPAYDLSPRPVSGDTDAQAIAYSRAGERASNFATLARAAADYGLTTRRARHIINTVVDTIVDEWDDAADEAELSNANRARFQGWLFLNRGTFYGYSPADPAATPRVAIGAPPKDPAAQLPDRAERPGRSQFDFRRYTDDTVTTCDDVDIFDTREHFGLGFTAIERIVDTGTSGAYLDDLGQLRIPRSSLT